MGGKRITPSQKEHYWTLRSQGFSIANAAKGAGFSEASGKNLEKLPANGAEYRTRAKEEFVPEFAIPLDRICEDAKKAIKDRTGVLFCRRYFGWELAPWQQQAWETMEALYENPDREFLLLNMAPGAGKSTILVAFACKRIVLERSIRVLFISRAHSLAERNTMRVRRALERTNLAVGATSTLSADFGRFRPRAGGDVWKRDEYVVEQSDGSPIEEKEPTVSAFGFDSEWIGNRVELVLGDDLDSTRSTRNMEIVEKNREVFDNELEPRLEPGGLFVVAQQRLGPFDFSAHCLSKKLLPDDDGSGEDVEGIAQYRHVIFKAHDEDRCAGLSVPEQRKLHAHDAPPWPDGCLLAPDRLGWRDVRKAMNNPTRFKIVYQQEDAAETDALVQKIWLDGGRGEDGVDYLGCYDKDRALWQLPDLVGQKIGIVSVDPSPTRYWACEAWVLHPDSEQRFLIDLVRERMEAPEFLDWSFNQGMFTGLLEDWWHNFKRLGVPLSHLVFEVNAAQRFLMQSNTWRRWSMERDVLLVPHSTGRNKSDPEYGVQMLANLYKFGKVRLPKRGQEAHLASMKLAGEVTRWPYAAQDDAVMAQWFMESRSHDFVAQEAANPTLRVPSWMKQPVHAGYL